MAFTIRPDGHGFILHGELDMANEHEFAAAFDQVLGSGGPVTVDMRQLRFMDSSGIKRDRCRGQSCSGRLHHPARRSRFGTEDRGASRGSSSCRDSTSCPAPSALARTTLHQPGPCGAEHFGRSTHRTQPVG